MAKCKECDSPVVWATVKNGKAAGKKRPFDPNGAENGRYGLVSTEEKDSYGNQIIEAIEYDDPVKGLSKHEELFNNHFFTCPNSKGGKSAPRGGGAGKVFVMVQVGGDDYTGYLTKQGAPAPAEEEPPF